MMKQLEVKNMNVPLKSISEIVEEISEIYSTVLKKGIGLQSIPTVMLWGSPGVGKSEGIHQIAEKIEEKTGNRTNVTDVRLLLFNPIDLRGIPIADKDNSLAVWLKPKIFDLDESDDVVNILFLDEISAAPQSVQAAAYQLCLERKIGEHILPENCIVIAAGNRASDRSFSHTMPKALCNRMMHFDVVSDYVKWRMWAKANGVNKFVVDYLDFDNDKLNMEADMGDLSFATPRSWNFVSNMLNVMHCLPKDIKSLIGATVGVDIAHDFVTWCEERKCIPSVHDILNGCCIEGPARQDVLYELVIALESQIKTRKDKLTTEELTNAIEYIEKYCPEDFVVMFIDDLSASLETTKLIKCIKFNEWAKKIKKNA